MDDLTPLERIRARQEQMLQRHGWYSHYVPGDGPCDPIDAHTHGLEERHDHADFQIVLPLPAGVVQVLFRRLADRVKAGERFTGGQEVAGLLEGRAALLAWAREGGRDVLRVVLPDDEGRLRGPEMAPAFRFQWDGCLEGKEG